MSKAAVKKLESKREGLIAHLNRFKYFLDNITPETKGQLVHRLKKFEELWNLFEDVQSEIETIHDSPTLNDIRTTFENQYYKLLTDGKSLLKTEKFISTSPLPQNSDCIKAPNINLPQIQLPIFFGDYDKWVSFHDNFQSLIHLNPTLSNVQKLHYLLSSLRGSAAEVIRSLEITDANYSIAWQLLKDRFENKKLIINSHLQDLFSLPAARVKDSHESLRRLVDSTNKNLRGLKSLGQPVDHWDTIIIYLINSKLDSQTKLEWEKTSASIDSPKLQSLLEFLSRKCAVLETVSPNKKQSVPLVEKPKQKSFITTKGTCPFCHKDHSSFQCKTFLNFPINKRLEQVKNCKLCINCLRSNHSISNCTSKNTCKHCNKKHNSLLHINHASNETTNIPQKFF